MRHCGTGRTGPPKSQHAAADEGVVERQKNDTTDDDGTDPVDAVKVKPVTPLPPKRLKSQPPATAPAMPNRMSTMVPSPSLSATSLRWRRRKAFLLAQAGGPPRRGRQSSRGVPQGQTPLSAIMTRSRSGRSRWLNLTSIGARSITPAGSGSTRCPSASRRASGGAKITIFRVRPANRPLARLARISHGG